MQVEGCLVPNVIVVRVGGPSEKPEMGLLLCEIGQFVGLHDAGDGEKPPGRDGVRGGGQPLGDHGPGPGRTPRAVRVRGVQLHVVVPTWVLLLQVQVVIQKQMIIDVRMQREVVAGDMVGDQSMVRHRFCGPVHALLKVVEQAAIVVWQAVRIHLLDHLVRCRLAEPPLDDPGPLGYGPDDGHSLRQR
jgi:hypothetical protein